MKNLGKKILIIFIFALNSLYASVVARVEPPVVYTGETATFILTVSGEKVHKPIVNDICGNQILGTSSQTSIEMVNMDYKKSYVLSYEFAPVKSCTIEPVSVEIDGKIEKSNAVKVVVKPAAQDKNADFVLSLKPDKTNVYVGEPFVLHLELKQNKRASAVDSKFIEPDFKGFWVKDKSQATREDTPEFVITKADYTLAAQREGNLTINPAQLRIATRSNRRDMWGSFMPQIKWKNYYSNEVQIHAKPLPNGAKIVGDFTISAKADKTEITSNEAVNVTVTVKGNGNLEDIGSFKPYIDGVNVFDEKVEVKGNTLTQKLAFVSDKDFTIPPFKLAFYNLKTKQVQQIKTEPIHIKVKGSTQTNSSLNIKKEEPQLTVKKAKEQSVESSSNVNFLWIVVAFVVGLVLGIALVLFNPFKSSKKEKRFSIKDEKLLLLKLLPYKDMDEDVKKIVDTLEGNLYGEKKEKIDKKLLKEIVKKYDIS
ncbi:MAG TPA: oxygen-tolerance protein [Sulfurimonas autotrophica]|uniref:Oxygen-tolerance protein n=1 Tax=Sulfurimonas autotrophica TaxID=202747 RepID=A0A7C3C1K5_9BACT|nr:oxygen-tolerance protein [Sulfurimonas autotrophica]